MVQQLSKLVEVHTRSYDLGVMGFNRASENKSKLMLILSDKYGWNKRKSINFFDLNDIKTPPGMEYYLKLFWLSLKKHKHKLNQFNLDAIERIKEMIS